MTSPYFLIFLSVWCTRIQHLKQPSLHQLLSSSLTHTTGETLPNSSSHTKWFTFLPLVVRAGQASQRLAWPGCPEASQSLTGGPG